MIMLLILAIIIAICGFAVFKFSSQSNQLTQEGFAKEFLAVLKTSNPDASYVYDAQKDMITPEGGNDEKGQLSHIYLGNLFNIAKHKSAGERQELIQNFIEETTTIVTPEEMKANLLPRLRTAEELSTRNIYMRQYDGAEDSGSSPQYDLGTLKAEIVVDGVSSLSVPTRETLQENDITAEEALEIAKANLANIKQTWKKHSDEISISAIHDDYDGARAALLLDLPDGFAAEDVVGYFPSHSICLLSKSRDQKTVGEMVQAGDELAADHRPLSNKLWHYQDGKWLEWIPEEAHESYRLARLQSLQGELAAASEQKGALEAYTENNDIDVFVASLQGYQNDEGDVESVAVLTLTVETWLPEADKYMINRLDANYERIEKSITLSRDEMLAALKEHNIPTLPDMVPVRYDVTGQHEKRLGAYLAEQVKLAP